MGVIVCVGQLRPHDYFHSFEFSATRQKAMTVQYVATLPINCVLKGFYLFSSGRRGRPIRLRLNNTEPEDFVFTHMQLDREECASI